MKLAKIFRQNPKQSIRDFRKGLNQLTPLDHLRAKEAGHFWGMLGGSTACLSLLLQVPYSEKFLSGSSTLGFGILVGGISYLQFVEWRKSKQSIQGLKKMNQVMGAQPT